jgi:hypothetical protein
MIVWRILADGVDLGLFGGRTAAAARQVAERAGKVHPGQAGVEVRPSAISLELTPTHDAALRAIVALYQAAVEKEREHWGEASAERRAAKGVDPVLVVKSYHRTLHALAALGLITDQAHPKVFGERLRKGHWGHRLGGTRTDRYVQHIVRPTPLGLEYVAQENPKP